MDEPRHLELAKPEPASVLPYRSPHEKQDTTQFLGMVIFLCAWVMLFCGLFLTYGVIRSTQPSWPPPGMPKPPVLLAGVNTVLILLAGVAYQLGQRALRSGARARSIQAFAATVVLGGMFLALQAAMWSDLMARGLSLESGPYGEFFLVLTGFHALHLGVGEAALLYVISQTWRGLFNSARLQAVRLWGMYWHSVTAIWCLTYLFVYVV
ncbi:MAG: heme-copper oxidase subunit III [Deltaproteobacteria bacterium]|nr:heme-copper oxidase subunit III [Deltaproteobacteria bacterium]